ncbi:MAG: sulfatase-like hydrolase/transferase [Verrucomicrobiales bacterium]|nr:sulfatase-like hydrolase/transferase [Verrucomicrobiales bacterium]
MIKELLLGVGLVCLVGGVSGKERPNVVMLLADDLGYEDIGCYGGPVKTPALDGLAEGGARFTDFYSGCAVCSPSRAVLLTGRQHIRAGVYSWIHDASQNSHLLEREVTLAEVLKAEGYATAHVGKWHLGLPTKERSKPTPDLHGFDHWFATWNNAEPSHQNPRNFIRNGEPVGPLEGYSCQLVADEAIGWLEKRKGEEAPFFLNVWFHEPHAPIAAPDGIVGEYGGLKDKAAVYSGTIDNTDRAIARLLAKLAEVDAAEDTLVIYASDNGSYRDDRTGGLRGRKGANWEGGIRVPGIFSWPGVIPAGKTSGEPAGLVDVLPTVCGLLGVEKPDGVHLDGSDLSAVLKGKDGFVRHQPLFWHLQKSRPVVAMRDGDFSLVAEPDYQMSTNNMFREEWIPTIKSGGYKNYQLFNLKDDRAQEKDLAVAMPEKVAGLKKKLLAINASVMADGADWHLGGQDKAVGGAAHNRLTAREKAEGWELLFDGEKIEGWRSYGSETLPADGWVVENGTLHKPADKRAGDMMTVGVFEDFEFSWEWKLLEGGNNGVKYFITEERKATVGHEYQMIDDDVVKDPYSSTASFYLVVKPREDKGLKPMGEWNRSRIVVKGSHVEHWLNGKKTLEYACGSEAVMGRVPKTKFKKYLGFGEKVVGHLLLTDHKDPCWYRNLKVRRY